MIKFFRKIRLDALPEMNSGQVSRNLASEIHDQRESAAVKRYPKYFNYAIGEIVLVAIGVLSPVRDNIMVKNK